jgi:Zn-dependent peptidase ImmA (M78 family)
MTDTIRPEQRIAQWIHKEHRLQLPVDISRLVEEYADVEEDDIPGNVDAVTITERKRPLIILDANQPYYRRRFTLAHELGHIIIPWHIGTFSCHAHKYVMVEDSLYGSIEAEANRFASELLIPSYWAKKTVLHLTKKDVTLTGILEHIVRAAEVSLPAACYAVYKYLEPGYIVISEGINLRLKSPGTLVRRIEDIERFDENSLNQFSSDKGLIETESYTLKWWRFIPEAILIKPQDESNSRVLIKEIIYSMYGDSKEGEHLLQSINGIIGSINSMFKPNNAEEFHFMLNQRIAGRPELSRIVKNPRFKEFLVKRIREIMDRR